MVGAPYPLVEFQRVTIAVADLGRAAQDWSARLGWAASSTSAAHVDFQLDKTIITLSAAAEGEPTGVGRVDLGVDDLASLSGQLARAGAVLARSVDEVTVDRAAVNGVHLVLHPSRPNEGPRASSQWRRINHLVVAVRDDEQAKRGWTELFGPWTALPTHTDEVAHHVPVGRAWFGLTSAGSDAGPLEKFVQRRGEGVYAIGLIVDNRAEMISDLTDRGAALISAPPQTFVHPRTTHGVLLDIVEA